MMGMMWLEILFPLLIVGPIQNSQGAFFNIVIYF